ncbi:hypothetical protein ACMV8I_18900 [Ewingella sp. S1.OA.A_B6]
MKYEYLKGSEKDFEGAQDECLVIVRHLRQKWIKHLTEFIGGACPLNEGFPIDSVSNWEIIAERRPITEQAWDGEHLPPTGWECEMQNDKGAWLAVDIIAHKDGFAFGWSYDCRRVFFSDKPMDFRPIRSPEDVARDAAIDGMAEIIEYRTGCSPKPLAKWLYDAGYRKME